MYLIILHQIVSSSQVFLAKKKDKCDILYAIKTMKKSDLVNKNMIEQGV